MLQVDHVYEFLYQVLFKEFQLHYCPGGVITTNEVTMQHILIFTPKQFTDKKIFFYDQEPFISKFALPYMDLFLWANRMPISEHYQLNKTNSLPYSIPSMSDEIIDILLKNPEFVHKQGTLVTSEFSAEVDEYVENNNLKKLYYFFHGFAALDWYRGYYALNYNKSMVKQYSHDFITFNRIINSDRSYRIYFVSLLKDQGLLDRGLVSFNVTDNLFDDWQDETADHTSKLSVNAKQHIEQHLTNISKLVIDRAELPGSASADIPRTIMHWAAEEKQIDAFWHIVTETVFYYNKLHLTEKIFKPIVSKQPFMLLAAPGNLAYLRSYGFKTFEGIIDESYDTIQDNDQRTEAVVAQIAWYCALTVEEKQTVIEAIAPIVEYNFHHFYGEFKHKITRELIDNCKTLFKDIGYDDNAVTYDDIYRVLTT